MDLKINGNCHGISIKTILSYHFTKSFASHTSAVAPRWRYNLTDVPCVPKLSARTEPVASDGIELLDVAEGLDAFERNCVGARD